MSFELSVDMEAPSNAQKKIHFKTVYGKALKTAKLFTTDISRSNSTG